MNRARLLDLLTSAALVGSEAQRSGALPLTRGDVTDYLLTYKVIRDALDSVDVEEPATWPPTNEYGRTREGESLHIYAGDGTPLSLCALVLSEKVDESVFAYSVPVGCPRCMSTDRVRRNA